MPGVPGVLVSFYFSSLSGVRDVQPAPHSVINQCAVCAQCTWRPEQLDCLPKNIPQLLTQPERNSRLSRLAIDVDQMISSAKPKIK